MVLRFVLQHFKIRISMSNYEIKIVRIPGHEDVIAKAKQIGKTRYRMKDACVIHIEKVKQEGEQEQTLNFSLALTPFLMPYMKQDSEIEVDATFVTDPDDRLIDKYNSLFSPIIQPKLRANTNPQGLISLK